MNDWAVALGWFGVGAFMLAFLVVDDLRNGRKVQKRDIHVLFVGPLYLVVVLVLGMFAYSKITSREDGQVLKRPEDWLI